MGIVINKKQCSKCYKIKTLIEFSKDSSKKDGLCTYCKMCVNKYHKKYYKDNIEKVRESHRKYYEDNKEKTKERYEKNKGEKKKYDEQYRKSNKEKLKKYFKKYNEIHKKERADYKKIYQEENSEKIKERKKEYYENNKNRMKKSVHVYAKNNREKINKYIKRKYHSDPQFRLSHSISSRMRRSIKSKDGCHWEDLVGYTLIDLKLHIEKQFKPGMSWENYGEWHIDHIKPITFFAFDSYNNPDFKKCWSLDNLQPLWAEENWEKGSTIYPNLRVTDEN